MAIQSEGAEGSPLAPGSMVGEYQITHKLGEGGMGVVYAGLHPEIGKRVAIKVLAPHAAVYPDLIRRFKEEARAVNKIRHPNIIDIFAFNQLSDGRHYFVMEYLDGESLTARLERGPMELREMRRLLGQICSALEAAHEAGIVHRDLKPDNIWVATQHLSESRIKLLDFGIAKLNDVAGAKVTQAGTSMGTPHYMPPEQGMGREIDQRADIYALGVILYQIFAGQLPFDGTTGQEIVFKHVTEAPVPPSRHRAIRPSAMEGIILGCLEKEPARRPPSVRELGARIDAAFAAELAGPAGPGVSRTIPRLATASTPPPSNPPERTEILPEAGARVPGLTAAAPISPTTMRGTAGELAATSDDEFGFGRGARRGRQPRSRRTAVLAALGVVVVAAFVAFGVTGHRWSDVAPAAAPPSSVVASPAPSAPPVDKEAAAAPAVHRVEIRAIPAEAQIALDRQPAVRGRLSVPWPADGASHELRVAAEGYLPKTLDLAPGEEPPAVVELAPQVEIRSLSPSHRSHASAHHQHAEEAAAISPPVPSRPTEAPPPPVSPPVVSPRPEVPATPKRGANNALILR